MNSVRGQLEALAEVDRAAREDRFLNLVRRFGEGGPEVEGLSHRDEAQTIAVELEHLGFTHDHFFKAVDRRAWLCARTRLMATLPERTRADREAREALRSKQAEGKAVRERLEREEREAFLATVRTSDALREAEQARHDLLRSDDPLAGPLASAYVDAMRHRESVEARLKAARENAERQRAPIDSPERLTAWIERERRKLVEHFEELARTVGAPAERCTPLNRHLDELADVARLGDGELDKALEEAKNAEAACLTRLLRVWK